MVFIIILIIIIIMETKVNASPWKKQIKKQKRSKKGLEASANAYIFYEYHVPLLQIHFLAAVSSNELSTILTISMMDLGHIQLPKHIQKYSYVLIFTRTFRLSLKISQKIFQFWIIHVHFWRLIFVRQYRPISMFFLAALSLKSKVSRRLLGKRR